MTKHVLSGAMAFALLAGVSYAQVDTSVSQQRTVVQEPDGDRAVDTRTTVKHDGSYDDRSVTRNTVRRSDGMGDTSTTSKTTRTNDTPYGDTSSTTVQRTTTDH